MGGKLIGPDLQRTEALLGENTTQITRSFAQSPIASSDLLIYEAVGYVRVGWHSMVHMREVAARVKRKGKGLLCRKPFRAYCVLMRSAVEQQRRRARHKVKEELLRRAER
jgi:hypothetical protein